MNDVMNHLQILRLHKHPEFVSDCVKLLNSEWPRSETARLRSLNTSCDALPTCLIMIYSSLVNNNLSISSDVSGFHNISFCSLQDHLFTDSTKQPSSTILVGHSKISRLHSIQDACLIESVVISKDFRGKGWGKYLMEQSELFVKQHGINVVYLTTLDKQGFYSRIGYTETEPIPIFGGIPGIIDASFKLLSMSSLKKSSDSESDAKTNSRNSLTDKSYSLLMSVKQKCSSCSDGNESQEKFEKPSVTNSSSISTVLPPPPPLPPPFPPKIVNKRLKNFICGRKCSNESKKTFMVKYI